MDSLTANLPEIIAAAAQSYLGILALLSVALSVLAYFFFASASEKVKVGIFVMLFLGVVGFSVAMFRSAASAQADQAADGKAASTQPAATSLSKDAEELLSEAVTDPAGIVMLVRYGEGIDLETNGKNFISDQTRRTVAKWEAALQELVDGNLLIERGTQGEVFEVTQKGYDFAESLAGKG